MSYSEFINTHTLNNNESRICDMLQKYCGIAPITIEQKKGDLIFGISVTKADYQRLKDNYKNCIYYEHGNIFLDPQVDRVFLSVKQSGIETYRS